VNLSGWIRQVNPNFALPPSDIGMVINRSRKKEKMGTGKKYDICQRRYRKDNNKMQQTKLLIFTLPPLVLSAICHITPHKHQIF